MNSPDEVLYKAFASDVTTKLYFYCSVIYLPIGLLCNLLLFIGFNSKLFEKGNVGVQMRTMAVFNSITLIWNILLKEYLPLIGTDISLASPFTCVLLIYLGRVFQQVTYYLIGLIFFLDYLSEVYPAKHSKLNKKPHIYFYITLIVVFILLANSISAVKYIKADTTVNNITIYQCTTSNTLTAVSLATTSFLRFLLPLSLLIVIHVLTISKLIQRKLSVNRPINDEKKLIFVFAFLDTVFAVVNFPLACMQIILAVVYAMNYSNDSITLIRLRLIYDFTKIVAWSYYLFGFVFSFVVNRVFRNSLKIELKRLIEK